MVVEQHAIPYIYERVWYCTEYEYTIHKYIMYYCMTYQLLSYSLFQAKNKKACYNTNQYIEYLTKYEKKTLNSQNCASVKPALHTFLLYLQHVLTLSFSDCSNLLAVKIHTALHDITNLGNNYPALSDLSCQVLQVFVVYTAFIGKFMSTRIYSI